MVDVDLLFVLIGHALKDDYTVLKIIVDSSRQAHDAPEMDDHVEYLYKRFLKWEEKQNKRK